MTMRLCVASAGHPRTSSLLDTFWQAAALKSPHLLVALASVRQHRGGKGTHSASEKCGLDQTKLERQIVARSTCCAQKKQLPLSKWTVTARDNAHCQNRVNIQPHNPAEIMKASAGLSRGKIETEEVQRESPQDTNPASAESLR